MTYTKLWFLIFAFLLGNTVSAQKGTFKLEEYKASNGITYRIGDRIKLKTGTGAYHYFKTLSKGGKYGYGYVSDIEEYELPSVFSNNIFTIKKIKEWDKPEFKGVVFSLIHHIDVGLIFLDIERGIEMCEVTNCINDQDLYEVDNNYKRKPNYEQMSEYKASNGINYKIGDAIKIAKGSTRTGNFSFLRDVGNGKMSMSLKDQAKAKRANTTVFIEKIKKYNLKFNEEVFFTVKVEGRLTNSVLEIESAIATCEIEDCNNDINSEIRPVKKETESAPLVTTIQQTDKYDQLLKIKKLFDSGILTEKEYLEEKKKILDKEH